MSEQLAQWLIESGCTIAFTGAGISTESGIPDFRSPGGIWSTSQPVLFDDFVASEEARVEYWRQKSLAAREFADAQPNVGHEILARWEEQGVLRGLITQNIDGLHHLAGSRKVQEIHGTARQVTCLDCGWLDDVGTWVDQYMVTRLAPRCPECDGPLKHATISFGQSLSPEVLEKCSDWARESDLFLVMGSSLVVHPAAGMPQLALQQGARLVIINATETPYDDAADLLIRAPLGETLSAVDLAVQKLRDPEGGK